MPNCFYRRLHVFERFRPPPAPPAILDVRNRETFSAQVLSYRCRQFDAQTFALETAVDDEGKCSGRAVGFENVYILTRVIPIGLWHSFAPESGFYIQASTTV